jgi:ribosomal protein L11 methyltransferase
MAGTGMDEVAKAPQGSWLELSVEADSEAVEAISELMSQHAYGHGIAVYEQYRQDPDGDNLMPDPDLPVTVVAYVPAGAEGEQQVRLIEEGLWHLRHIGNVGPLMQIERPEEDWANAWREHFHVLRIGNRFVIRPTWREYEARPDDLVIDLDPGMAFGTGHHPTTELCLTWLESLPVAGKRVLDVGAGSGILSIAGILLVDKSIDAIEIDDVAARALRENLEMNGVGDRVRVVVGDFGADTEVGTTYDLVIANIISSILVKLSHPLAESIAPGGQLLLSGVIDRHLERLQAAFTAQGLKVLDQRQQGDWFALLLERDD